MRSSQYLALSTHAPISRSSRPRDGAPEGNPDRSRTLGRATLKPTIYCPPARLVQCVDSLPED